MPAIDGRIIRGANEIGVVIFLLETPPGIAGHTVAADARLTRRALAGHLLGRTKRYSDSCLYYDRI